MKERAILHSDANCFYASVETVLNPTLRGKMVAVCGSTEEGHGIVPAKSEQAKRAARENGHGKLAGKTMLFGSYHCVTPIRLLSALFQKATTHLSTILGRIRTLRYGRMRLDVTHSPQKAMCIAEKTGKR